MFLSFPPESLSFAEQRGKQVSSFEKVLVSAGNDWSGNIIEGKEVSDWIGMGSCFCRDQDMKIQKSHQVKTWPKNTQCVNYCTTYTTHTDHTSYYYVIKAHLQPMFDVL
jgi:hypothetical protein